MISGSMVFSRDMLELKKQLEKIGHSVVLPIGIEYHLEDPEYHAKLEESIPKLVEEDIMRKNFDQLASQDAVLIFNKKKNNIFGYMGVSMLMELALAYFLNKKIFILYDIPHFNDHRWAHEVMIMQPTFLQGDILRINS